MAMNCWWKSWLLDKGYDAGIDIGPLSVTRLSYLRGRWNLSAAGCITA